MKKNKTFLSCASIVFALAISACSSRPTQSEIAGSAKPSAAGVSIETQQVAAEQKAEFVTELIFSKKQEALSTAQKNKIQGLINQAAQAGKIKEVKVITWADAEYPSIHTKKLSSDERKIATDRNKAIESYINGNHSDVKVKTYSMAERASSLKEFIGSSEARIKKSLEVAGIPTTDTTVKYPSKASKSILLVILE